jgi:anti-sigma regulatory factor (Ser/Thr protein kinase)
MRILEVSASLDSMEAVQDFVIQGVDGANLSEGLRQDIRLVLEEVFSNIVFYAYPGSDGTVRITCFWRSDRVYSIRFSDSGVAFNPLEYEVADLEQDFGNREIGGLGIHLVKRLVHEIHYTRDGQSNVLTVSFRIGEQGEDC